MTARKERRRLAVQERRAQRKQRAVAALSDFELEFKVWLQGAAAAAWGTEPSTLDNLHTRELARRQA